MNTTFDKNAEKFANLVIEKIESLSLEWSKPWFSKVGVTRNFLPQNLSGRTYAGGNAFLLFFLCEKYNYQTPVFVTFKQAKTAGICVLKGSESFPVYYLLFCAFHRETGDKITLEQYKALTDEEQKDYKLVGTTKYYLVFNLDQTNFSEIYPERWDVLKSKFAPEDILPHIDNVMYSNSILDTMLSTQSWICPIKTVAGDRAFFSPAFDKIELPLKSQFKDGESFYCTELHEMTHSTGTKERLNRKGFNDRTKESYGREELVAELTAALTAMFFGISTTIRNENVAYLKSWCKSIKEEPKFLLTVLTDAMKATKFIADKLDVSLHIEDVENQVA